MQKTSDFDYSLPKELIAQEPASIRDHSRLMVLNHKTKAIEHKHFYDISHYLKSGDLLVLNDTKVIPANLVGVKEEGGAKVEVLLVSSKQKAESGKQIWLCLVKPGKRLKVNSRAIFGNGKLIGRVIEKLETGEQLIEFESKGDFWNAVHELGEMPLPPYINPNSKLANRYQTLYAIHPGASAAPTAGLHFTPDVFAKVKAKGVKLAYITLHTGLATFRPVWTENIEEHNMHSEYFEVPKETIEAIRKAKRVVAVGTTSVRALEAQRHKGHEGETDLFIYPGYKFKVVDAMITNFHWPRSTLIMLVSAFAGKDFIMKAYQEAIQKRYRFYSFGDAMLIV
ncbi:MAG: tRNA preQ1(34) S-adenosylmethionine ribosyltransferase-isomerase QueA [Candidatus Margulisiibacteriota bacterium]